MTTKRKGTPHTKEKPLAVVARSLEIVKKGVKSSQDMIDVMAALMCDSIEGNITPGTCNAACNAAGKLMKMLELQIRYGTPKAGTNRKELPLLGN